MKHIAHLVAPAKLTLSLRVNGVRADGFHQLSAEMVSIDLADELTVDPDGDGLELVFDGVPPGAVTDGPANLVRRALQAVGRRADVRLVKRIPVGGGLGGGSADAGAVLRWAGCSDLALASELGADVPFCVRGGRAQVEGIGEQVTPLNTVDRTFVLLIPPVSVDTGAVYRAWDQLPGASQRAPEGNNDLLVAALEVAPELALWRDMFKDLTGRQPQLAGSGATWFVEAPSETLDVIGTESVHLGSERARLVAVRTVESGWGEDSASW